MNTRFLVPVCLMLAALAAHGAEPPADGLYFSAEGASAPRIQTQDGKTLFLGAKRDLKVSVQDNRVAADNNANTTFWLHISVPNDGTVGPDSHILVVAGTAYRLRRYANSGGTSSMSFQISGDANARQIAQYFSVPVAYLRHPGYQLSTSFTPIKTSFARGENVIVTLKIVNVGAEAVAFMNLRYDGQGGGRGEYIFSAYRKGKSIPDIGDTSVGHPYGGSGSVEYVLQPGATFERTINLSKWFEFKEPGSYQIHGSCSLDFLDPIKLLPFHVWTDYVGADFDVTIN